MINFNPQSHSLLVTSKSLNPEKPANADFSQLLGVAVCCAYAVLWRLVMTALSLPKCRVIIPARESPCVLSTCMQVKANNLGQDGKTKTSCQAVAISNLCVATSVLMHS